MGAVRLLLLLTALLAAGTNAIYPDDHFDYSTKLTESNFESFVQDNLNAGKTTFVRFIASSGW